MNALAVGPDFFSLFRFLLVDIDSNLAWGKLTNFFTIGRTLVRQKNRLLDTKLDNHQNALLDDFWTKFSQIRRTLDNIFAYYWLISRILAGTC